MVVVAVALPSPNMDDAPSIDKALDDLKTLNVQGAISH